VKSLRLPLGPWGRGLVTTLLLAGASGPGLAIPRDAAAAVAVVVFSLGFPIALARETLPRTADGQARRAPALGLHASRPRAARPPRAPRPFPLHPPPAFLRHRALLC
jgi:hypothetical protein